MTAPKPSTTPTWPTHLSHLAVNHGEFLRGRPVQQIAAGALVFEGDRLLLVQRSASEKAFPNRWEFPGGSVDEDDLTILHAVARELFEETGLVAAAITHEVGNGVYFQTGRAKWLKLSFIVVVQDQCRSGQEGSSDEEEAAAWTDDEAINTKLESIPVKLDRMEHQSFVWATEEDIKRGEVDGMDLDFVSPDQVAVMLEGFRIRGEGGG